MLILYSLLLVSAALVDGSAIKGHPQVSERSLKAPASAPKAPILESSKRVYNDESIRRLAVAQQAPVDPAVAAPVVAPVAPVAPVAAPVEVLAPVAVPVAAAPVAPVVAPVVVPVAAPVVAPAVPVAPSAPVAAPVPVPVPAPVSAPVSAPVPAPVSAPVPVPVAAAPAKPDELPAQSDRSAPIKAEPVVVAAKPAEPESPVQAKKDEAPVKPAEPESALQAKKDEAPACDQLDSSCTHIEVPAPDPGLVLSEPIDSTTKLLIDLDEHVQKFLPAEDKAAPGAKPGEPVVQPVAGIDYSPDSPTGKSSGPLPMPYAHATDDAIVPPLPSLDSVEKASSAAAAGAPSGAAGAPAAPVAGQAPAGRQGGAAAGQNQQQVITQLLDQLDSLQNRIQDTINQLVARRRYVMSALLRPMGTYVRRVRTNLERLQNRVNQLQAAAVSVGGGSGPNRPGGFVDAAAIETIRRRIDDISKRISDIVNRIRFSLTPTSAPLNNNGRR